MDAYDNWKTSPPEPKVVGKCAQCKEDIVEGEFVFHMDGDLVHEGECWTDYAMVALDAFRKPAGIE
jgi:hypothetical protein